MIPEFQAYVGPKPFEEKDKDIFFGRNREARDLRSLVIAHRLVLVYAQSGAGKTSLINAGLIPLLKEKRFEVFPVARVKGAPKNIKTEEISNIFVLNTLTSLVKDECDVERLAKMKLIDFLNSQVHMLDEYDMPLPRAVIFDQFEEIFSLYQDRWKDRQGFFEQVSSALEADPLLRVVFVMREDFIAQLDSYASLLPERLRTRFHIEQLRREAALLAIKEPLRNTGRSFAEGVAEKLVDDLLTIRVEMIPGNTADILGEFIEAVQLQVVCQSLWQELPPAEKQITFQHLKIYGDVEQELSVFYDEVIRAAAEKILYNEDDLRALFDEVFITTMGTRGMAYRTQESTGHIPNAAIDVLESMHLIRAEWRAGARWYELTHDRFIKPIQFSNKIFKDELVEKKQDEGKRVEKTLRAEVKHAENKILIIKSLAAILIIFLILAGFATYQWIQTENLRSQNEYQKQNVEASNLSLLSNNLQENAKSLDISVLLAIESFRIIKTPFAEQLIHHGLSFIPQSVVILNHNNSINNIVFSPDGKYVATASNDNTSCIWDAITGKQIFVLPHDALVHNVVFSPDGKYIATASRDNSARVWNAETGKQIFVLQHNKSVNDVVYSPDGKYIATASDDNTSRVWDTTTGRNIFDLQHNNSINNVVYSPDGKYIASASDDSSACIWNAMTGKQIFVLQHNKSVNDVVYSPDGKYIATASWDKALIWNASTGRNIFDLQHNNSVNDIVYSPDGKYIATASDDSSACIWNATTGKQILVLNHFTRIYKVAFSPDGKYVATASYDNTARVWDAATGKQIYVLNHRNSVYDVAFSPDGKYVATASADNTSCVWNIYTESAILQHNGSVNDVVFSPDGKYIATASSDNTSCVWDAATGKKIYVLKHDDLVNIVAFSPDGKFIATASKDNKSRIWNVTTGKQIYVLNHQDKVYNVVFSPDGKYIATSSNDSSSCVWDAETGKQKLVLKHSNGVYNGVFHASFSFDGKYIATASKNNTSCIWDAAMGNSIHTLNHGNWVHDAEFSPDGKYIATASDDSTARLWNATTGEQIFVLPHDGVVQKVVFSPDGKYIATASFDSKARLWNSETGELISVFYHDMRRVYDVEFSPDGKYIATASNDKTARVWDAVTGKQVFTLNHDNSVIKAVFSPDRKYIATASLDNTSRLWKYNTTDLINGASNRITRNLTPEEWKQYMGDVPYHKTFPNLP